MPQRDMGEHLSRSGFPNPGYVNVNVVNPGPAQTSQNAWFNRRLNAPAGGTQQVDIVLSPAQGLHMNMQKWCGGHMHADEKSMVSPQVVSALMAKEQRESTTGQKALPSTGDQVTKALCAGTIALKKARAMMPAVNLQPTVPNARPRTATVPDVNPQPTVPNVRPRRGRRIPRSSTRPEN